MVTRVRNELPWWLVAVGFVLALLAASVAYAQGKQPIRIGFSIAQTGPLSGAGKSGLLALQIWRDDVNARGGLLGRPVELVVYDDQGNPALTPGIYTKLIDVDKVDLLIAPYAHQPDRSDHAAGQAARSAADRQFRARSQRADPARQVLQQSTVGLGQGFGGAVPGSRQKARREDHRRARGGRGVRTEPGEWRAPRIDGDTACNRCTTRTIRRTR